MTFLSQTKGDTIFYDYSRWKKKQNGNMQKNNGEADNNPKRTYDKK